MNDGFKKFIAAPERDRLDIFLAASRRLGTAVQNVEKDFWVCWTLDVLYHGIPPGSPRLLFKGGTSLCEGSRPHQKILRGHRYHGIPRGPQASGHDRRHGETVRKKAKSKTRCHTRCLPRLGC